MQKKLRMAIIGAVLVTVSLLGVYWVQRYLLKSRASAAPPTAHFGIVANPGPKINPGEAFDLILQLNPNLTPFYSFDVAFTYDPAKVSLRNTDPATILDNIIPLSSKGTAAADILLLKGSAATNINTETNTVRISGLSVDGKNNPFTGRESLKLVKITFVMNEGQALPLDFKWLDPEPAKITISDSFEKIDLNYTGEEPTPTPTPISVAAVAVPTTIPVSGAVAQATSSFSTLKPVPTIMGSSGREGTSTFIREQDSLLYINSIATYQSPFRYEQPLKLSKGTYQLLVGAKIYVRKERGIVVAIICNESTCGKKKRDEALFVSSVFPVKTDFSEMSESVTIPDDADGKQSMFRIFCEDGSECELDYISLEDAWGSQMLTNNHFGVAQHYTDTRQEPADWIGDLTSDLYGSVNPNYGYKGALMINNSAK